MTFNMEEKIQEKPTLESLFEDLCHPNPNINKKAYLKMIEYWPKESMSRLLDNLDHADIALRRISVKALGAFGASILLPITKTFYLTNSKVWQTSCLKVFVQVASDGYASEFPHEAIVVINQAFEDDTPEIILTVIPLLKLMGEMGYPLLLKACADKNILRSFAAITAIVETNSPKANDFLKEVAERDSTDKFVKKRIEEALRTDFM